MLVKFVIKLKNGEANVINKLYNNKIGDGFFFLLILLNISVIYNLYGSVIFY